MTGYNYELRFFEDSVDGVTDNSALFQNGIRVFFVVSGGADINGVRLEAGQGSLVLKTAEVNNFDPMTKIARWELVPIGSDSDNPVLDLGQSKNKRTDFIFVPGGKTGLRLDTVTFPPGTCAYKHIHASCGIRFITRGSLEINTDEGASLMEEGHAWFEAASSPVLAIADETVETQFARVMVLPVEYHGKLTITYVDPADDDKPREQINNRFFDEIIDLT